MAVSTLDSRTALVVVDLQNGTRSQPAAPYPVDEVVGRVAELARGFRAAGLPVVLVRFTAGSDGAGVAPIRTDMSGRGGGGTPPEGWDQVVPELAPLGDVTVAKRNWGSFSGTDLDLQLRRRGVTQVVLVGVATSIGVESTARAAQDRGFNVTVVLDAVTDLDAAAHHHTTTRIFPMLAETGTAAEVLQVLATTHPVLR
jgi:nicotinamidase-related amidase